MNCKHVEELVPLYVGRDLEEKRARLVKSHVQSCAECARLAEEYREAQRLLQLFEPPPFGEAVYAGIRQRVLREIARESSAPALPQLVERLFRPRTRWAVATALLLVVSVVAFYFIAERRGGRQQVADRNSAAERTGPAERQSAPLRGGESPVPLPSSGEHGDRTYQAQQRKSRGAAAGRPRTVATRDARSMTAAASRVSKDPAEPDAVAAGHPVIPDKPIRVEMQTKDPNIRIIWIAHQRAKQDSLR
ncbi:MAG TPA: zf-HC2 domain-containing protein [Pyrinomonadaceae bacterium]|nr:zf-HC2 domain-containing protein [Pyrinomonadaceae bacterium]